MSEAIECPSCGAVLLPQDEFCGECGTPRPSVTHSPASPAGLRPGPRPEPVVAPAQRDSARRFDNESAWRAGFYALVILGVLACLLGVVMFLAFGLSDSDVATPAENWLYSTLCCLLPIGGAGGLMLLIGLVIWRARLREPGIKA